ncbi:MAG: nitrite reductase small subunit NirD [Ignavibacteriales bacterium]|nr:nitrite reductase small subunit NirD [Ignavibacteriales bacterium]
METMNGYTKICRYDELKEKIGRRFFVDDVEIALFKVEDKIYALSNICPHQKTHLIHEGFIEEGKVTCPVHGWQFELQSGRLAQDRKGLDSFEVKIIDNDIYVKVTEKKLNW